LDDANVQATNLLIFASNASRNCWVKLVQTAALINLSYQKKKKNNELKCK
jgi:general stress protein CsbA